jgi:hypothetical protein
MLDVPGWLTTFFIFTTLLTYVLLLFPLLCGNERVQKRVHTIALLMLAWVIFQSTLSLNGWYMDRKAMPPHLFFPIATSVGVMLLLFFTSRGKRFLDGLSFKMLAWIHVVRFPVEICLYYLAVNKQTPWSMTYFGHNFDIVFGITAPFVAYFGYSKQMLSPNILKGWNILGLISLLIVVVTAIGAAPGPLQSWDFDQPNFAVMHFPFSWLPAFIVPVVLFAHFALLRKQNH